MRILGIDYGSKRVGLALTDEGGSMAFPHAVIENSPHLVGDIEKIINDHAVEEIVIGHSLNAEGDANPLQGAITEFVQDLTVQVGLPVYLEPEQYTTQAALRTQGRNSKTDASAAALILDGFLQKRT